MKKITATIFLLLWSKIAFAQVLIALVFGSKLQSEKLTFGLNLIPTLCDISNTDGDYRSGFGLGLYFDIKMSDNLFLHPEAIPKSVMGADDITPYPTGSDSLDAMFVGGAVTRKIRTISLPLLVRYRIKGLFYAEAGPQIDWMLKVKDTFERKENHNELSYETRVDEHFTRFDLGMVVGLHQKLKKDKGMGLGVRYFYGITDLMKENGQQTNQTICFIVAIPVGAGKAEASNK